MSKVMPLAEAVRTFVRPGMSLYFGGAWAFPNAAMFEIVRQFVGRDPGFTLILSTGGAASAGPFLAAGLARRVVAAFLGDGYPTPGPNPAIQRAINSGKVAVENWTMLTLTLRLLAAALNLPHLPTRSILGSSLEGELADQFRRIPDPFQPDQTVGLVPALRPDLAITHGWAADPDGNTILPLPLAGNSFGALAAKEGAIVTVEKIVAPGAIRARSNATRIPAHAVRAVCEAPFGAHPLGCLGLDGGYIEDRAFMLEARAAARAEKTQAEWIQRWILEPRDHADYLARLGPARLAALKDFSAAPLPPTSPVPSLTDSEKIIVAASREIVRAVRERGYRSILCGLGAAHLAAWLAEARLRAEGITVTLLTEVGAAGIRPLPGDAFLFALRNALTAPMIADTLTALGMFVGSEQAPCLGVLGAAQVDRRGSLNTTRLPDGGFLMGSGGANDVASTAQEVIIVARQSRTRFVERVNYVTSPGASVSTVVTQLGVFRKVNDDLILSAVFGDESTINEAREACGWDLQCARDIAALPLPDAAEREALHRFDPLGDFWRE